MSPPIPGPPAAFMGIIPRSKTQLAYARCIASATSRIELDTLQESLRQHVSSRAERQVLELLIASVRLQRFPAVARPHPVPASSLLEAAGLATKPKA